MAGNPSNAIAWSTADVYLASLAATNPTAGATFTLNATSGGTAGVVNAWDFVGLLDGSAGFAETQAFDSTDFSAWGAGVIATNKKNLAITKTFTCLEDNPTALALRYDTTGLTVTGANYSGTLKGRNLNTQYKVAFQVQTGTLGLRLISKNYAVVDSVGDATQGEDNISSFAVTMKVIPNSSGVYWDVYKGVLS